MATPKNVMSLGDTAKCRQIIATEIGSSSVPVTKIWGFVAGSENLQDTCDVGNQTTTDIIMNGGILHTTKINDNNLDNLYIRGKVGFGIDPADPIDEDVEIAGNLQIDTAGLGRIVFYDKAAGHEHAEFDADDDGTNGGKAIIKVKEDGGTVQTAMTIREDRIIEFDKIQFRDGSPGDPVIIGQNVDLGPLGVESTAYGENAGTNNSGTRQVSVGWSAGRNNGGSRCVCIGDSAGEDNAGNFSVNIGLNASNGGSGEDAVVIGNNAGRTQADDNCIILNASGADLNSSASGQFLVNPIRSVQTMTNANQSLFWNSGSGEVFVDTPRYDITTIAGGSGTVSNLTMPLPSMLVLRWVAGGPANWIVNLPFLSSVPLGTRIKIKNSATASGNIVEVRPFTAIGNTIDGSTTSAYLNSSSRTTTGGGGRCIELVAYDASTWMVVNGYNGTY